MIFGVGISVYISLVEFSLLEVTATYLLCEESRSRYLAQNLVRYIERHRDSHGK